MFSLRDISLVLKTEPLFIDEKLRPSSVSIDSRKIQTGAIFFALKTENNDGHQYLESAFESGAFGAVVSEEFASSLKTTAPQIYKNLWVVADPYEALKELAIARRKKSSAVFIGITGSVGKTSTKQFLSYFLGKLVGDEKVLTSRGNFNNHLGLPLTLLELNEKHEVCICELGANHAGEIESLCEILKPEHGILTGVSACHLEGFGSLETIYETKFDLIRSLPKEGIAIVPAGDEKIKIMANESSASLHYVSSLNAEIKEGFVHFSFDNEYCFSFPADADFYASNATMALTLLREIGYDLKKLPSQWKSFSLPEGRFSRIPYKKGIEMIFDGYNASPFSFAKGIQAIDKLQTKGRKVLVFSDMLELGNESEALHRQLGDQINQSDFNLIIAYGQHSKKALESIKSDRKEIFFCLDTDEASRVLKSHIKSDDLIYFKASRGMRVEKVRDSLMKEKA